MQRKDRPPTLDDFLGRPLTEEEVAKLDDEDTRQRTYAPTLELVEMCLYKFTLQEGIREVEGDYGPSKVVQVLNGRDGKEYSLWLPTVLYRKLRDHEAGKGVTVGVVYKGVPQGKRYKDFAVFVWTDQVLRDPGLAPKSKKADVVGGEAYGLGQKRWVEDE